MLHCATVEDNEKDAALLTRFLSEYGKEHETEIEARCFSNPASFIQSYHNDYDLLFLDIEMPLLNGIDTASAIRRVDPFVTIVFVTNMAQYAIDGYAVNAFDYLLKPLAYWQTRRL